MNNTHRNNKAQIKPRSKVYNNLPEIWIFATSLENCSKCFFNLIFYVSKHYYITEQGRNQLFISGGNFHELSFDDVIVLIQEWYNIFANGQRYVPFATFPKMRTY